MIGTPKRESPTGRALVYCCDSPGEVSVETLARHLWQPPRRTTPFTGPGDYREWRIVRVQAEAEAHNLASRILRRLTEAGYLESQGGPRVAIWFTERVAKVGMFRALKLAAPGLNDEPGMLHAKFVGAVALRPPSVAAVIGDNPSGRVRQVWGQLNEWGVILPARARFPTAKAIELVGSWTNKEDNQ